MRISDWSSDVCSSDLPPAGHVNAEDGDRHVASRTSRRGSGSDGCPRARVHRPADRRTAAGLVIAAATSFPSIERLEPRAFNLNHLGWVRFKHVALKKEQRSSPREPLPCFGGRRNQKLNFIPPSNRREPDSKRQKEK